VNWFVLGSYISTIYWVLIHEVVNFFLVGEVCGDLGSTINSSIIVHVKYR